MAVIDVLNLENILIEICSKIQISSAQRQEAEDRYQSMVEWLEGDELLGKHCLDSYAQGSLRHGTTVKPISGEEFDLDFIFPLVIPEYYDPGAKLLLERIEARLEARGIYRLDRTKNSAARVIYTNEFHIDIVPAIPIESIRGRIKVPHRRRNFYFDSNPEGFAQWLDGIAIVGLVSSIEGRFIQGQTVQAQAAPLPSVESVKEKPPLKKALQLLKRNRDIRFAKKPSTVTPASILLTAMAGYNYGNETSVEQVFNEVVPRILRMMPIYRSTGVPNPVDQANPKEDLARAWKEYPNAYQECFDWLQDFAIKWEAVQHAEGLPASLPLLKELFGEKPVDSVYNDYFDKIEAAKSSKTLAVNSNGNLKSNNYATVPTVLTAQNIPVQPHKFFGVNNER